METLTLIKIIAAGLVILAIFICFVDLRKEQKDFDKLFNNEWREK